MRVGDVRPVSTDGGPSKGRHRETADDEATAPSAVDGEIRVLHVDDEPALLEVTEQFLRQEDERIAVETATSPQEGLVLLNETGFDVVVSDYQMPGMNGLEFLKTLREDNNQISFIIFTGHGREEVAVDALNLGADRYLQKGGHPKSQYGLLADAVVQETEHRRAREELRESEERYRTLVEAFPDIVFITDYDSQMLWANDALERQTGLTIDDFQMEQEENPFIHSEDADHVAARLGEFIESSRRYSEPIDNRFIDADGDVHWYSSVLTKVTYDGEPALQFITRNISDRKEREHRLQQAERRYRAFLDAFPSGIAALFDDDYRYIGVGGELLADTRFSAVDIEGEHIADVDVAVLSAVDAADCRAVFDGTSLSRTTTFDGQPFEIRLRPVAKDDAVTAGLVASVPV